MKLDFLEVPSTLPCRSCGRDLPVMWSCGASHGRVLGLAGGYGCETCDTFSITVLAVNEADNAALVEFADGFLGGKARISGGTLNG